MESSETKVTILTLVYNGLPYLKESIDSTLNQSYKDFKFLIIDDASPDPNVSKLIESYDDNRIIHIVNEKNMGVSDTFNKALEMIDTTYTVRIDQDDINSQDRVKEQVEFLENNKGISIICSWEHTINSEGKLGKDWKRYCNNYGEFIGPVLLCICPLWHPSIAFRTQDMIQAGGFKKEYTRAEDFEVTARMAYKRYEAYVIPSFHLYQRQHESSQSKEFEVEQTKVANQIQKEIISNFLVTDDIDDLAAFLRAEIDIFLYEKSSIMNLSAQVRKLLSLVKSKKRLNLKEYKSLYLVFLRRLGLGFFLEQFFRFLPNKLYLFLFLISSPQFNVMVKTLFKKIYNSVTNSK